MSRSSIPVLSAFDSSLAVLKEGYRFIGNRCDALGSDIFRTRIMLSDVVCMRGPAAAEIFYRKGRFTRRGAMPRTALALLQGRESVQMLEGEAHRHRKHMFMEMMSDDALARAADLFRGEWEAVMQDRTGRHIVIHDAVGRMLTRTAIRWCGLGLRDAEPERRAEELAAMIDGAGRIGPSHARARLLRRRCERWARGVIHDIREGLLLLDHGMPAERIALHRDPSGDLLSLKAAAVELINLLRPIVAVGRFVVFAAHALHTQPSAAGRLSADASEEEVTAFVQEVRRFYPFFPVIGGRVLEAFTWRGHPFAPGDWVLLDLYGTNHDPGAWTEPETFAPARFYDWAGNAHMPVPQGGGGFLTGHRCPGEWLTIALTGEAVRRLLATKHRVPEQDLEIPMNRFPTGPRSGFVMEIPAPSK
ncbi:cytochrome P450 [Nitratireductor sp. GCM10026969]|uniref:cytochrome P450 n=1 Tax=Nitratireductor sp. GCM10026969 TaxID=3252645 RepID=UPI0036176222